MSKAFGYSYLLDMYGCADGVANDLELCYRFLEELVDKLQMHKMSAPYVIHGPTNNGVELFPDKLGFTGFVPLIESAIVIHGLEPKKFITLDVYSCKWYTQSSVYNLAKKVFQFQDYEHTWVERGIRYHE